MNGQPISTDDAVALIVASQSVRSAYVVGLGRTAFVVGGATAQPVLAIDAMGCVTPVATGVALGLAGTGTAVVACDTDGSIIMELGALAGLAACAGKVDQLVLFVFDNGLYESGGGGPSRFFELDWEALFQAFGLSISVVDTDEQLSRRLSAGDYRGGVRCTVVQVANEGPVPRPRGEIDGRAKAVQFAERIVAHSGRSNWRRAEKL